MEQVVPLPELCAPIRDVLLQGWQEPFANGFRAHAAYSFAVVLLDLFIGSSPVNVVNSSLKNPVEFTVRARSRWRLHRVVQQSLNLAS